jgi:hypothetical protein
MSSWRDSYSNMTGRPVIICGELLRRAAGPANRGKTALQEAVVVKLVMAWSPVRRFNAGMISRLIAPETTLPSIPADPATAPSPVLVDRDFD